MAKIYYKKYKAKIDAGEITLPEALELVNIEVPEMWREQVKELLKA